VSSAGEDDAYARLKNVASLDAQAAPDVPDEQTLAGELAHEAERKKAKTAALRAEEAEEKHVAALNRRIHVLQTKLDLREDELRELLPRNAELEQARSNATINGGLSLSAVSVGGMLASVSSLFPVPLGYISGGFGAA
jgi:chromosome segregation ATPase